MTFLQRSLCFPSIDVTMLFLFEDTPITTNGKKHLIVITHATQKHTLAFLTENGAKREFEKWNALFEARELAKENNIREKFVEALLEEHESK